MNWQRVMALVRRYTYLYTRSFPRVLEMFFWPVMDLFVWGLLTKYLIEAPFRVPGFITFLIGAMIFWDILYRAQQSVTISFLEDIWARNVLNIFVAPIRITEFILSTYIVGFLKVFVTVTVLGLLSYWLYSFSLFEIGWSLVPLFANLLIMGWAIGLVTAALIMRWGQSAEALAWGVPFLIQPFAAVFYPVEILPKWIQPIALSIPATHVFEGMRQVLAGDGFPRGHLISALWLNIIYLILAALFFRFMFGLVREKGLLTKLGTQ